jgi:hypothetical protein
MKRLIRAFVAGFVLAFAFGGLARAEDKAAAAPAAAAHKVGDKIHVCGCGKACTCETMQAGPGKCHCGKDLVEGTVTKVEGGAVTVKTAAGEQVFKTK